MDTHCDTSSKRGLLVVADILAVLVVIIKNEKKKVVMVASMISVLPTLTIFFIFENLTIFKDVPEISSN